MLKTNKKINLNFWGADLQEYDMAANGAKTIHERYARADGMSPSFTINKDLILTPTDTPDPLNADDLAIPVPVTIPAGTIVDGMEKTEMTDDCTTLPCTSQKSLSFTYNGFAFVANAGDYIPTPAATTAQTAKLTVDTTTSDINWTKVLIAVGLTIGIVALLSIGEKVEVK